MNANEAPEKIYIGIVPSISGGQKYTTVNKDFPNAVEYTRTDAFIEKAKTYLKEQFAKDVSVLAGGVVRINFETAINNFINYMKGE